MPITYRCVHCRQLMSISRRRAGEELPCARCDRLTPVPTLEEAAAAGGLIAAEGEDPPADAPPSSLFDLPGDFWLEATPDEPSDAEPAAPPTPAALRQDDEDEDEPFLRPERLDDEEMDLTPMVDVTFLLLIFFMVTASFSLQKSLPTEAPEEETEGAAQTLTLEDFEEDAIIVSIDEDDLVYVDDELVRDNEELERALTAKANGEGKLEMIIEPHPQSTHGATISVMDVGIAVGMQRIRRVTRSQDR